jgi:hypothetical protein
MQHLLLQQPSTSQTSCKKGDYDCVVTFLRVTNVTDGDGGTYTCVINDKYNNTKNNSRTVEVIGEFYFSAWHPD